MIGYPFAISPLCHHWDLIHLHWWKIYEFYETRWTLINFEPPWWKEKGSEMNISETIVPLSTEAIASLEIIAENNYSLGNLFRSANSQNKHMRFSQFLPHISNFEDSYKQARKLLFSMQPYFPRQPGEIGFLYATIFWHNKKKKKNPPLHKKV